MFSPLKRLTVVQKGTILVVIPLGFGFVMLGILCYLLNQAELETERASRAKMQMEVTSQITGEFFNAARTVSNYLYTKNQSLPARVQRAGLKHAQLGEQLQSLSEDERVREVGKSLSETGRQGYLLLGKAIADADSGEIQDIQQRYVEQIQIQRLGTTLLKDAEQLARLLQETDGSNSYARDLW